MWSGGWVSLEQYWRRWKSEGERASFVAQQQSKEAKKIGRWIDMNQTVVWPGENGLWWGLPSEAGTVATESVVYVFSHATQHTTKIFCS